jgi:predicted nucleic acid-binding protein
VNVVDSSGWIEYLAGGPNADFFAGPIEGEEPMAVPSIVLFEVYRHVVRHVGREEALSVVAALHRGTVVDLDASLALEAAELSLGTGLAMADSLILATTRALGATLWTQDVDFDGMEDVRYRAKPSRAGKDRRRRP